MAKYMEMHNAKYGFTVKRNNEYSCLSNDRLKFLDVSHFLAPGSSYVAFLKAFKIEEKKGFFPYEYFDCVSKLDSVDFPPYEAFYSELKGVNILEAEWIEWNKSRKGDPPKREIDNYVDLQWIWMENEMQSFRDLLTWYNNLDVGPMCQAVTKLQNFYRDSSIDVFKTAISVPGVARQMLFDVASKAGASFALFDEKNKDLFYTVSNNLVGGPSIIFTRHHKTDETLIRGQKPCKKVLGFDANALYLWAFGEKFPVGPFIRRQKYNQFKPQVRDKYMSMYYWMDWVAY